MFCGAHNKYVLTHAVLCCAALWWLQWAPDDRMLASGGNDNALLLWQVCCVLDQLAANCAVQPATVR